MGGCGAKVLGRPCRSWVKVGSGEPFAESPSTPMNGHHQSGPAGPFRANIGSSHPSFDHLAFASEDARVTSSLAADAI
jgi:hypothetical protein